MSLNDILRLPAHKLGDIAYEEYAPLLTDVVAHRHMLSSTQKRETNSWMYRLRANTIAKLDRMKAVLAMHPFYDRYCEALIARVPQSVAA